MNETLNSSKLSHLIEDAILEDIGLGDVTTDSIVPADLLGHGDILLKEEGIVAGLEVVKMIFSYIDPDLKFNQIVKDGSYIEKNKIVATVDGAFASILKTERTALNILQRMSGIATLTKKFVDAVADTKVRITDTRKTAPCLRLLDKLAVQLGGGINHRFGLDDMVIIKDNHIAAAGGISEAIKRCQNYLNQKRYQIKIEVETKNLDDVKEVLKHQGIDRIMLDNFQLNDMKKAVEIINHSIEVEASGNVSLDNVREIAETGVDYISIGALTHSPKALDISLKIVHFKKI